MHAYLLTPCMHAPAQNEILDYNPADYPWPTLAYPWLTEHVGTGPYVFYNINFAAGRGNLVVFDESTHNTVMSGVHYPRSVDEIHNTMTMYFWELGDADLNGEIRVINDLAIMAQYFLQTVPPGPPEADINGDGTIDIRDMAYAGLNYGEEREVFP